MGFAGKEAVYIISILTTCLGVSALIIMNQELIDALLGLLQAVLILGLIVALMLKGRDKMPKKVIEGSGEDVVRTGLMKTIYNK